MGIITEALFCIFYLIATTVIGILILRRSKGRKSFAVFGVMALVLVFGDSFKATKICLGTKKTGDCLS